MISFARRFLVICCCLVALAGSAAPQVEHVFIISIDGGAPEEMLRGEMPVVERLAREGAHSWWARTTIPSITLPAHTSMLTGVSPEQHHILWNDYRPTNGVVQVPTVFSLAKQAGLSTAMFVGKEKFRHLLQPGTVDEFNYDSSHATIVYKSGSGTGPMSAEGNIKAAIVAHNAAAWILQRKPNLAFIHFADPDTLGHEKGWGSPEQIQALAGVDDGINVICKAIRQAGIARSSVVLISADHGGHNRGHSQQTPRDMRIPWLAWGAGVRKHFEITDAIYTCDTTATALWLLGITPPATLDGKAVQTAFSFPVR